MSILDKYETSEHRSNIAHFTAIVNLALVDGLPNAEEEKILINFARKFGISKEEYKIILKNPDKFPMQTLYSSEGRLECIYDLFKIIYADHTINEVEEKLIHKYILELGGYSEKQSQDLIKKSIKIFSGTIDFEDYQYFIDK